MQTGQEDNHSTQNAMKREQQRIALAGMTISNEDIDALCEWLKSYPRLTKGALTSKFESGFSRFLGAKYSSFVNSGSSANLLIAATNLHYKELRNKKVIIPAVSWATTLAPFVQLGYEPILVDCDTKNLGVNVDHLQKIIDKDDPATMILVHVLGHDSSILKVSELCEKHNIRLFEDTCEALGSEVVGRKLGTYGLASSFSFYFGHHISTIEGGMVSTNNFEFQQITNSIRSHGWNRDLDPGFAEILQQEYDISDFRNLYTFYFPGFNLRATEISAAIGLRQLEKLSDVCRKRQYLFNKYAQLLNGFWLQSSDCSLISSFAFGTLVRNPDEIFSYLKKYNIESRPLICGSLGLQPYWRKHSGSFCSLPIADIVHKNGIYLPLHCDISDDDINRIAEKFKEVAIPYHFSS